MKQTSDETSVSNEKSGRWDTLWKLGIPRLLLLNVPCVFPDGLRVAGFAGMGRTRGAKQRPFSAEAPVLPRGLSQTTSENDDSSRDWAVLASAENDAGSN